MLLAEERAAAPLSAASATEIPPARDLGQWALNEVLYDSAKAARAGFVFGGTAIQASEQLFVSEFSRSKWVDGDGSDRKRRRYGVAIRLLVKASSLSAQAKLGLSFLAAEAQTRSVAAQSELRVVGYVGSISSHFITQGTFDVENYVKMRLNMDKLVQTVAEDQANIRPALLEERGDEVEEDQDFLRVVGQLWALSMVADRKSCTDAKQQFPGGATGLVMAAIEDTYGKLSAPFGGPPLPCDDNDLGQGAREFARARLRGLKLKRD